MNKKLLAAIVLTSLVPSGWALTYNDNITAIFGNGNPNTGWTSDSGANGLKLALRAKDRDTASTANVNGIYTFAAGYQQPNNNRALWNWEFSINSGASALTAYDFYVGIDLDPGAGINYQIVNALTFWTDNSYGISTTLNGQGIEASPDNAANSAALAAANSIAQQSQNLVFGPANGNPLLPGTYNYELFAVAAGAGQGGARLAQADITVVTTPDSGSTMALLGFVLTGFAGFSIRKRVLAS